MSTGYFGKEFVWKSGTQFPVEAKTAAETIMELQKRLGRDDITAKELLDDSRADNAPLHSCFTWDDTVAAEKWRVYEAGHIIRSIVVIEPNRDGESSAPVRAFINVTPVAPKKQGNYVAINVAMMKEEYRRQALSNALIELRNFQRKYQAYDELSKIFEAINDFGDLLK